jgi:predicted AlkP superfamily pyrophosphatase or phosphodiesterase
VGKKYIGLTEKPKSTLIKMKKTVVIDVVGLSRNLIGEHTPFLKKYTSAKSLQTIAPMLPAVTTAVQSTYLTGKLPAEHGIVGNGWYDHTDAEIKFWKQSNKLASTCGQDLGPGQTRRS